MCPFHERTLSKPYSLTKGQEWSWMSSLKTSGSSLPIPRHKYPSMAKPSEPHQKMTALYLKFIAILLHSLASAAELLILEPVLLLLKLTTKSTSSSNCIIFLSKTIFPRFQHTMMQGMGWWEGMVYTKTVLHIALWPKHKHASNYSQKTAET